MLSQVIGMNLTAAIALFAIVALVLAALAFAVWRWWPADDTHEDHWGDDHPDSR